MYPLSGLGFSSCTNRNAKAPRNAQQRQDPGSRFRHGGGERVGQQIDESDDVVEIQIAVLVCVAFKPRRDTQQFSVAGRIGQPQDQLIDIVEVDVTVAVHISDLQRAVHVHPRRVHVGWKIDGKGFVRVDFVGDFIVRQHIGTRCVLIRIELSRHDAVGESRNHGEKIELSTPEYIASAHEQIIFAIKGQRAARQMSA